MAEFEILKYLAETGGVVLVAVVCGILLVKGWQHSEDRLKKMHEGHMAEVKAIGETHAARMKEICDRNDDLRREEVDSRREQAKALNELTVAVRSFNRNGTH